MVKENVKNFVVNQEIACTGACYRQFLYLSPNFQT